VSDSGVGASNAEPGDVPEELAPARIDCIDCGGVAHLLTRPDDTGRFWPGDLLTYRCEDCLDRWDLIIPDGDDQPHAG
jgi:hypothetical protein